MEAMNSQTFLALKSAYTSITGNNPSIADFSQNPKLLANEAQKRLNNQTTKISIKNARDFLRNFPPSQVHKQVPKTIKRSPVYAPKSDNSWQADVAYLSDFSKANDNKSKMLVVIDCFSRYGMCAMMRSTKSVEIAKTFASILKQSHPRKPKNLFTDDGGEFKQALEKFCHSNNIKHIILKDPKTKASMAERFIRSMKLWIHKYITNTNNLRFIDILPNLVNNYNLRSHRSLPKGLSPAQASLPKHHSSVYDHLYTKRFKQTPKSRFNFMLGDACTVPKTATFDKGFRGNWDSEIFFISKRIPGRPVRYQLADTGNRTVAGTWYEPELQKINQITAFQQACMGKIKKVIRSRRNKLTKDRESLVVFERRPRHNYWINSSLIEYIQQGKANEAKSSFKRTKIQPRPKAISKPNAGGIGHAAGRGQRQLHKKHACNFC